MSFRGGQTQPRDLPAPAEEGDELAYVLLEEARLRCEQLIETRPGSQQLELRKIHRELGLAGWRAGSELDVERRPELLNRAHQRSTTATPHPAQSPHALATAAITAEDALATINQTEHLHLAHLHLLCAMGLLAHNLY